MLKYTQNTRLKEYYNLFVPRTISGKISSGTFRQGSDKTKVYAKALVLTPEFKLKSNNDRTYEEYINRWVISDKDESDDSIIFGNNLEDLLDLFDKFSLRQFSVKHIAAKSVLIYTYNIESFYKIITQYTDKIHVKTMTNSNTAYNNSNILYVRYKNVMIVNLCLHYSMTERLAVEQFLGEDYNFGHHDVEVDYSLIPNTTLTEEELFSRSSMTARLFKNVWNICNSFYKTERVSHLMLTKTSYIRASYQQYFKKDDENTSDETIIKNRTLLKEYGVLNSIRRNIKDSKVDSFEIYDEVVNYQQSGAAIGLNPKFNNKINTNVAHRDSRSFYPFLMLTQKFISSKYVEKEEYVEKEYYDISNILKSTIKEYNYLLTLEFTDLTLKPNRDFGIISISRFWKLKEENDFSENEIDYDKTNKNLISAKKLYIHLNLLDVIQMEKFYDWKSCIVKKCISAELDYLYNLNPALTFTIIQAYQNKRSHKSDVIAVYNYYKQLLNSIAGFLQQDKTYLKKIDAKASYKKYREMFDVDFSDKQKFYSMYTINPFYGERLTALGRYYTINSIISAGISNVLYWNTDGLYYILNEESENNFEKFNAKIHDSVKRFIADFSDKIITWKLFSKKKDTVENKKALKKYLEDKDCKIKTRKEIQDYYNKIILEYSDIVDDIGEYTLEDSNLTFIQICTGRYLEMNDNGKITLKMSGIPSAPVKRFLNEKGIFYFKKGTTIPEKYFWIPNERKTHIIHDDNTVKFKLIHKFKTITL